MVSIPDQGRQLTELHADLCSRSEADRALERRVSKIAANLEHVATKSWMLGGVLASMATCALIVLAAARLIVVALTTARTG